MMRRGFLVVLLGLIGALGAFADCMDCDDGSPRELLSRAGFDPDEFEIVTAWREAASGAVISGFRLKRTPEGSAFDVYLDEAGNPLDDAVLPGLGIRPKNWDYARDFSQEVMTPLAAVPHAASMTATPLSAAAAWTVPEIPLPVMNNEALLAEDDLTSDSPFKGAVRAGVFVEPSQAVGMAGGVANVGEWRETSDARVWAVSFYSQDAVGLRLRISDVELPPGAYLTVYNADQPAESHGPLDVDFFSATGGWAPSVFGERITLECVVPVSEDVSQVVLIVSDVIHIYRPLFTKDVVALASSAAGFCNIEVSCRPAWAEPAKTVGRMAVIRGTGLSYCSAALVADSDPTAAPPYLLTAFHCVASQQQANTVEMHWLYQTGYCGGAVPSLWSVPRTTGGAAFLVGSNSTLGTDMSLLLLNNQPPSHLPRLGWTTAEAPLQAPIVGIHHPQAEHKRICFGTKINTKSNFHVVVWDEGTTEPGSSGSPLMLADTQQLIGALSGGLASCNMPTFPDEYGRFDRFWPLAAPFLGPPPEEEPEEDLPSEYKGIDLEQIFGEAEVSSLSVPWFSSPSAK